MAVAVFFIRGHFRKGFSGGPEEENGIVPEPRGASRIFQNLAFHRIRENGNDAPPHGQGKHADEARPLVFCAAGMYFGLSFLYALRRRSAQSGIARRLHARRATERIDD